MPNGKAEPDEREEAQSPLLCREMLFCHRRLIKSSCGGERKSQGETSQFRSRQMQGEETTGREGNELEPMQIPHG